MFLLFFQVLLCLAGLCVSAVVVADDGNDYDDDVVVVVVIVIGKSCVAPDHSMPHP